jgi:hypothetical protein
MPSSPLGVAPADAPLSLSIDIGGTFTDLIVLDPSNGNAVIWKESTTPDDPTLGTMLGLANLVELSGIAPEHIGRVIHATTLFSNDLIERKGAPTGLMTTAGFADVLEIGRERKYELYDLFLEMPPPLVPRPWRHEVPERLAPDGSVEIPLDVTAVLREVEGLVADGEPDETLVALIRKNVRTPDETIGDLWAQVVALDLMEDRLLQLMAQAELADLQELAHEIQLRCETAMRAAISALPDGTYHSALQTDGLMDTPIELRV